MKLLRAMIVASLLPPGAVFAEPYRAIQDRRPDLFDAETGMRSERYRAPTPDDIPPPAAVVSADEAFAALAAGAVAVDVFGLRNSRYDEIDGTWVVTEAHESIPGAVWLPEVGRGVIEPDIAKYLSDSLSAVTGGDPSTPLVVFCRADCWMSWNAARRISALGYARVLWFPLGVEGWAESGRALAPVAPRPVGVD